MGNPAIVPNFVAASTPQGLRQQCLLLATSIGHQVIFDSPMYVEGEKMWYCWYRSDASKEVPRAQVTKRS